jgi:transposase
MAAPLVSDDLWALVEPLLPPHPPRPKGGRPSVPDRACFTGIVFVLKTGIQWEDLPQEMGCGSGRPDALRCRATGPTCWRRLRDWQRAGVLDRLQTLILARLEGAGCLGWSRAVVDASLVRARGVKKGATGRAQPDGPCPPVDEGRSRRRRRLRAVYFTPGSGYRSDLSPTRISSTKSVGCSHAAKCPPLSSWL